MCAEGEVYCWMNCLPAPACDSDYQLSCYNDQHVECCSDYNDEPCEDMDDTCQWECVSTPSTVSPVSTISTVSTPSTVSNGAFSDSICSINFVVAFCLLILYKLNWCMNSNQ